MLVDDPAADLHEEAGRFFYFAPDELEPLTGRTSRTAQAQRGDRSMRTLGFITVVVVVVVAVGALVVLLMSIPDIRRYLASVDVSAADNERDHHE